MNHASPTRYTDASRRLLDYMRINRDDTRFADASPDREIVYIFDTSVLEAYWRRSPQSANGQYGTDPLLTPDAASYSGWLSLKFLIEHRLPGLKGTAFISPAHWNEALERVDKYETEIRNQLKISNVSDLVALDRTFKELLSLADRPAQLIQEAEQRNVGDIFRRIIEAVSSAERIRRIFVEGRGREPGVRDLTACEYYWQLSGRTARHQDFRRWHASIAAHREEQEETRKQRDRASSRNNENDALTLASIEAMYRGNPESSGRRPSLKFVFVTPDAVLHRAFRDLWPSLDVAGIPWFIRHPHVYAPLLNHASMSAQELNGYQLESLKRVFYDVESALEPLFSSKMLSDARHKEVLNQSLSQNIDIWSKTVETLCLSNSHYILSDAGGEYASAASLARVLSSPEVREAAAASVTGDLDRIRDDHMQVLSVAALDSLDRVMSNGHGRSIPLRPHRAPVKLIGADIPGALGFRPRSERDQENWLDDLLKRFRTHDSARDIKDIIERMRVTSTEPERQAASHLLASCIFFAVDAWDFARMCAELCQDRLEASLQDGDETKEEKATRHLWLREARYCEALAIRMHLRSADDVLRGKTILIENIAKYPRSLPAVRDRVERATLILTAAIVQTIDDDVESTPDATPFVDLIARSELPREFDEALQDLHDALDDLDNFDTDGSDRIIIRIRYQAGINRLGAILFQRLLGQHLSRKRPDPRKLRPALAMVKAMLESGEMEPTATLKIYLAVGAAIEAPDERLTKDALALLASPEIHGAEMSRADRREIDFFTRVLRKRLTVPLSAAV